MSGTRVLRILTAVCLGALLCASVWITFRTWPRKILLGTPPYPSVQFDQRHNGRPLSQLKLCSQKSEGSTMNFPPTSGSTICGAVQALKDHKYCSRWRKGKGLRSTELK